MNATGQPLWPSESCERDVRNGVTMPWCKCMVGGGQLLTVAAAGSPTQSRDDEKRSHVHSVQARARAQLKTRGNVRPSARALARRRRHSNASKAMADATAVAPGSCVTRMRAEQLS